MMLVNIYDKILEEREKWRGRKESRKERDETGRKKVIKRTLLGHQPISLQTDHQRQRTQHLSFLSGINYFRIT